MALPNSMEDNVSTEELQALGIIVMEQFVTQIIVFPAVQELDALVMKRREKMNYVV